jgi:hypothetical protein
MHSASLEDLDIEPGSTAKPSFCVARTEKRSDNARKTPSRMKEKGANSKL